MLIVYSLIISRSLVSSDGKTGQKSSVHTLAGQEVRLTSHLPPTWSHLLSFQTPTPNSSTICSQALPLLACGDIIDLCCACGKLLWSDTFTLQNSISLPWLVLLSIYWVANYSYKIKLIYHIRHKN